MCIRTDGDFSFSEPEPEFGLVGDEEGEFFFETREDAVNAIVKSFHYVAKFLNHHCPESLKELMCCVDERIELICRKIPTFTIDEDLGNHGFTYELLQTEKILLKNGSYRYECTSPAVDFTDYHGLEELDLSGLEELLDVDI